MDNINLIMKLSFIIRLIGSLTGFIVTPSYIQIQSKVESMLFKFLNI